MGNSGLLSPDCETEIISDEPVLTLDNFNFERRPPPSLFSGGERSDQPVIPFSLERPPTFLSTKKTISDTAKRTCDTILLGFEMTTSLNILMNGNLGLEYYGETNNGNNLLQQLDSNRPLWIADKASVMYNRFKTLEGLLDAVKSKDAKKILKIYYKAQHQHVLGDTTSQFEIPIYIDKSNLNMQWVPCIDSAVECINIAAPGLQIYETSSKNESIICITSSVQYPDRAYTTPEKNGKFTIYLGSNWVGDFKGTATHELLHALGFHHEMQRWDADLYLKFKINKNDPFEQNYRKLNEGVLTRFDPFSVLMYSEDDQMKRKKGDPIWRLKPSPDETQELSELNKVALNLLYKPIISDSYKPEVSPKTGMLYCGRKVMDTHNQCNPPSLTDSSCGPEYWANCPACRVIKAIMSETTMLPKRISKLEHCIARKKWQGLSGFFYCGKRYSSAFNTYVNGVQMYNDGICGLDNGIPCTDCGKELFPEYSWRRYSPRSIRRG